MIARDQLRAAGFKVLGQRVRTSHGEIDLVARRGHELVCVEVKTSLELGPRVVFEPGNRFRPKQLRRQIKAAKAIARELRHSGGVEVALCEVWLDDWGAASRTRWHRRVGNCTDRPGS